MARGLQRLRDVRALRPCEQIAEAQPAVEGDLLQVELCGDDLRDEIGFV
jgi:hypothetical protein